jgi:hypothetical protein
MQKIATGQWELVEKSDYLRSNYPLPAAKAPFEEGDGWYIIRTRPK